MKKLLSLLAAFLSLAVQGQTLFVPGGASAIGTTTQGGHIGYSFQPDINAFYFEDRGFSGITGTSNVAIKVPYAYWDGVGYNPARGFLDLIKTVNGNTILGTRSTDNASLGNVGIGTINPQNKLHVTNGEIMASHPVFDGINVRLFADNTAMVRFSRDGDGNHTRYHNAYIGQFYNQAVGSYSLGIGTGSSSNGDPNANTTVITIPLNGNVGIGTTVPDKPLTVKGTIHTNEVLVDMNAPLQGPDYVFEKDYDLLSLADLERYIRDNKHLPEIPSAKEMEQDGLNLKEMNLLLLKKVEEMTLHILAQQARIKKLETKLNQ